MAALNCKSVEEGLPATPGNYLSIIDWDSKIAHERWFDGEQFYCCNLDPEDVEFDDSIIWPAPVTHWAEPVVFEIGGE